MDMFNSEFRSRLSLIVSPLPSSICFSKVCIASMLVSGLMLMPTQCKSRNATERDHLHEFRYSSSAIEENKASGSQT